MSRIAFTNGRFYTVDAAKPWAEVLIANDGLIEALGSTDELANQIAIADEMVELGGKLVLPGFVESHIHLLLGALLQSGMQFSMSDSIEDVCGIVRAYSDENPELPALFGYGYNALMFDERGPSKATLDELNIDRPIILFDHTIHGAWANSKAFMVSSVTAETPDPSSGTYVRDAGGSPSGAIKGSGASVPMMVATNALDPGSLREALTKLSRDLSAYGFTAALDCGNPFVAELALEALAMLVNEGAIPLRLSVTTLTNSPATAPTALANQQRFAELYNSETLWFDTLKIMSDSVIDNQTAAMIEPYATTGEHGSLYFTPEELTATVGAAAKAGQNLIIHALGDRAVHESLNAAQHLRDSGDDHTRVTLTHCEVVQPADIPRFAALDVSVQTTSNWAVYWKGHADHLGQQRNDTQRIPMRSWVDAGVRVALGADWPATPGGWEYGQNPFVNIYTAMHRRLPQHLLEEWGAEDRVLEPQTEVLTLEEAIAGYTVAGAEVLGREAEIGSLEVGKRADFLVLDRDLFAIEPAEIVNAQVDLTVFAGEPVFQRV